MPSVRRTATGMRPIRGDLDGGEAEREAGNGARLGAAGGHRRLAITGEENVSLRGRSSKMPRGTRTFWIVCYMD